MKHISLFSGIGGFELAAQWAGWDNIASCEINPFGRKVLEYYWPDAYHHDDVHTFSKKLLDEKIPNWQSDELVLIGGFPCQPYSLAGKRLGKDDDRHLWPEMLRIIQELKPSWVVGENVFGLVNWNDGVVFDEVQTDLEAEGYEVQAFVLPACAVNAPHRRDRVWIVAHANNPRNGAGFGSVQKEDEKISERHNDAKFSNAGEDFAANASCERCNDWSNNREERHIQGNERTAEENQSERNGWECGIGKIGSIAADANQQRLEERNDAGESANKSGQLDEKVLSFERWDNFPTQPPVCGRDDGFSSRLDGITFSKWRNESIKAYGNAIVPQVVYQIFQAINEYQRTH